MLPPTLWLPQSLWFLGYLLFALVAVAMALHACALLVREGLQKTDEDLRYIGFRIPPKFVIGYGLDFAERYRNLPYVAVLEGEPAPAEKG